MDKIGVGTNHVAPRRMKQKMEHKLRKYPFKILYISTALCIWN